MQHPNVAILGASGFVGAAVARRLVEGDWDVVGSFCDDSIRWHTESIGARWERVDPDDPATLRAFVRGAQAVVYCPVHRPSTPTRVGRVRRRGVRRLRAVLDACVAEGVMRVVYVSDAATLFGGEDSDRPADEGSRYVPGTTHEPVFEAASAMEAEVYRYVAHGLDVVVVVPTLTIGPGDVELTTGRLLRRMIAGRVPIGAVGTIVNAVDVRDVAAGISGALRRGRTGRRYVLGGANAQVDGLVDTISSIAATNAPRRVVSPRKAAVLTGLARRLLRALNVGAMASTVESLQVAMRIGPVDNSRARGELEFAPRPLESTLRDAIEWMHRVGYIQW